MPGEDPLEPVPITAFRWNAAEQPLTAAMQRVFEAPLVYSAPTDWSWTAAPGSEPNGSDRVEIDQVVQRLRRVLLERQAEEAIKLQAVQLEEMAAAVGDDVAAYQAQYRTWLAGFFADETYSVAPYATDNLVLEVMAGGRIVRATQRGGVAVRARTTDRAMAIDPYLSKIGGVWTIVR
jgi:hypothetical protein